jgi:K+ transporter
LDVLVVLEQVGVVTAVAGCATMMWFATVALDGVVKLWSDQNVLVRELDLHVVISLTHLRHPPLDFARLLCLSVACMHVF